MTRCDACAKCRPWFCLSCRLTELRLISATEHGGLAFWAKQQLAAWETRRK